ncbi:MAG: hypothetical protein PHS82_03725 [Lachnospiraceae bacterium]|nr:hypothetical protein [Lachnospiraceae bacterium]
MKEVFDNQGYKMKKIQIFEVTEQFNHAGTKATADVAAIAEKMGYEKIPIRMTTSEKGKIAKVKRQIGYLSDYKRAYNRIPEGSTILLQHPFHYPQLTRESFLTKLKEKKHVKFISLVHDVEELRAFRYNEYYKQEFETMLKIADAIIVHNEVMKKFFEDRGVQESKLVDLKIFDYLQDVKNVEEPKFEKSITIAGNLDTEKCGYIGQLGNLEGVQVQLYGPNFDERMKSFDHIHYHGSFPVDEIPSKLNAGFGLVWDGESLDGCQGLSGQYLRFNNPHKLSLYLSSGLPVVIWNGAAEAEFVRKQDVGICVDSILELPDALLKYDEERYRALACNVKNIRRDLIDGKYILTALEKAQESIGGK